MKKVLICIPVILLTLAFAVPDSFYPIDGYERTGIDRLAQLEKIVRDSIAYNRIPAGAYLSVEDIKLRLTGKQDSAIAYMTEDAEFQKKIHQFTCLAPRNLQRVQISI